MNAIFLKICMIYTASPIMNEMRKKAGTDVFCKNHYGQFIRKRVKGTNPKTAKQLNVRAVLSYLSKHWKALTAGQITAWNNYGHSKGLKNRLGADITLTGEAWYIKLNRILSTMGSSFISDPPDTAAIPPDLVTTLGATIVSATSITMTAGSAPAASTSFNVFASKGLSKGKSYNSNYRFITKWLTADGVSFDITTPYNAVFGAVPATGAKVFFKVIATDTTNGLQNQAQALVKTV
jgi:hypothetical protein